MKKRKSTSQNTSFGGKIKGRPPGKKVKVSKKTSKRESNYEEITITYSNEISSMMYIFGDSKTPLTESVYIVESYVKGVIEKIVILKIKKV
jgi:hypothetical protein